MDSSEIALSWTALDTPDTVQPVPEGRRHDIDDSIEVRLGVIVTTLLCGNEFLDPRYFREVLVICCVFEMGV